jgi:hypothetical protein
MPVWSYERYAMKYGPGLESTQGVSHSGAQGVSHSGAQGVSHSGAQGVGGFPKTYVMVSNGGKEDAGWTTVYRRGRGTKRSPVPLPK